MKLLCRLFNSRLWAHRWNWCKGEPGAGYAECQDCGICREDIPRGDKIEIELFYIVDDDGTRLFVPWWNQATPAQKKKHVQNKRKLSCEE